MVWFIFYIYTSPQVSYQVASLPRSLRCFVPLTPGSSDIVDIKPANMEELTEVITAAEFHPHQCNTFVYSSSKGTIRLCDMRTSALCDKHSKCESLLIIIPLLSMGGLNTEFIKLSSLIVTLLHLTNLIYLWRIMVQWVKGMYSEGTLKTISLSPDRYNKGEFLGGKSLDLYK